MKVKLWGTRGSIPSPKTPEEIDIKLNDILIQFEDSPLKAKDFLESLNRFQSSGFGGDTTCVEVKRADNSFLIDCGSGLRRAGLSMLGGDAGKGKAEIHIYLTHFHWDHLMGLPFFIPIFIPGNIIHFYSVDPILEESIKLLFKKPYFPVAYEHLGATIKFHQLEKRKKVLINNIEVTPYKLDHPDPCWGLKVEDNGKSYSHCVDTEAIRVNNAKLGKDIPLYQNADVVYFDAQYSFKDHIKRVDWGHSATTIGLDLAFKFNIKTIIFTHHDPAASDEELNTLYEYTKKYYKMIKKYSKTDKEFKWLFAYDGLEIDI